MEDEPIFWLLFWFYDEVEERYGRVIAGVAQFALGLVIVAALVGFITFVIPAL